MELKDSGWLEKLINAMKNWKKHVITSNSYSGESKAHGSDVMTLLFENAQNLDKYQRKFGASTISQQHILHFVSNVDRFTSVEIKGMGGEQDYLAFCEDGFLIADFEKWQEKAAETELATKGEKTGTSKTKIHGEWSKPMSKVDMMLKLGLGLRGYRKFDTFAQEHPIRKVADNRQVWQIRVDKMPENLRRKFN